MKAMVMNEKIKAIELQLTGLDGEDLGILTTKEALALAKAAKVDLVCINLLSSPPPCKLMSRGTAKQKDRSSNSSSSDGSLKVKEIRLTATIEDHDYETKLKQSIKLLQSHYAVQLVVKVQGKDSQRAKELLERMLHDTEAYGTKKTGVQVSGKQVQVTLLPLA